MLLTCLLRALIRYGGEPAPNIIASEHSGNAAQNQARVAPNRELEVLQALRSGLQGQVVRFGLKTDGSPGRCPSLLVPPDFGPIQARARVIRGAPTRPDGLRQAAASAIGRGDPVFEGQKQRLARQLLRCCCSRPRGAQW